MNGRENVPIKHILKRTDGALRYEIRGRIYRFVDVHIDGGARCGYCHKLKKWAYLYPASVVFEDGEKVLAKALN